MTERILKTVIEGLKPYITAKDKCRKLLFDTVGMLIISAALSAIMLLFIH